ncbi:NAD(P)-binding domain-containing protein [Streptomyces kunmingensis]|uniref:NAD(P)-binding domain-containing protein n=1 Tax=Streptomyces kunmingensis TaxID=68225 RepID=A0ABU6CPU1_9ACTN|nr:FAD-dependent oxidoreductase [Streptomyces kunmingensis]MEB3966760.1 NAD(P)-binding domain-containing protein [Streptomyces kunmingensis]
MIHPVAVIGAGPYGLSTAAHLRARGIPVRVFGEPMVSWRSHMPAGMILKSFPSASNIDAPQRGHDLVDYCDAAGIERLVTDEDLVPAETFVAYGDWFQRKLVPDLERVHVVSVDRRGREGFELKLDSGEQFTARAVVVATGLSGLEHLPRELAAAVPDGPTPTGPLSHSAQHHDLSRFAGKELIVIGAGQSALETAALAAEAGASVQVVARGRGKVRFGAPPWDQSRLRPQTPFGRAWSLYALTYYPHQYRQLPPATRHFLIRRVLGPLGAWWLRDRFEGKVAVRDVAAVEGAVVSDGAPVLTVRTHGGRRQELSADHVIAATGYRVDLAAMPFLGDGLRTRIAASRGTPRLGAGYVSSVPGLYFTGMLGGSSYGPVMRFVCGTEFASSRVARHLAAAHG